MEPITKTIDLNSVNQLRITVSEFQGKQRLDIRHWYREGMSEWNPTKKGINLSIDSIGEFRKALDQVFAVVEVREEKQ
jgi:hypothetical protein